MTVRNFSCPINGEPDLVFYGSDVYLRIAATGLDSRQCDRVGVPLLLDSEAHGDFLRGRRAGIRNLLRRGLNVSYGHEQDISACSEYVLSVGVCGTGNLTISHLMCLCIDQLYSGRRPQSQGGTYSYTFQFKVKYCIPRSVNKLNALQFFLDMFWLLISSIQVSIDLTSSYFVLVK